MRQPGQRLSLHVVAAYSVVALGIGSAVPLGGAQAQEYYKGKTLILGIPNAVGGSYDVYTRLMSRHIAKYIPGNPSVIVQNVPAAAGLVLANQMYNTSPRDGTYMAMIRGTTVQEAVVGNSQVKFNSRKFTWIANMDSQTDTCVGWTAAGINQLSDFYSREVFVGASAAGATSHSLPTAYKEILGMKLKIVTGYAGTPERILAMEQGEITGACGVSISGYRSQFAHLVQAGKVKLIAQAGLVKDPRYPDVPNILDQAKTTETRQALEFLYTQLALGRAFAAPPDTHAEATAILRKASTDAMADREFLAEADKLKIDIKAMDAAETIKIVERMLALPKDVVARVQRIISQ